MKEPTVAEPNPWIAMSETHPIEGMLVETKIDDGAGVRNCVALRLRCGRFFFADDSMYVYYVPTHWRCAMPEI